MKNEMTPKVSVIITTFNRSALVVNAIESVLSQTYTNYEIIVIDDGSTDDTAERLRPFLKQIRYCYQENRGVSAALNKGIELSKGEWIARHDSDDRWLPRKLELQIATIAEIGTEFGMCFTDCSLMGRPGPHQTLFGEAGFQYSGQMGQLDQPVQHVLARHTIMHGSSLLIKRDLVEGVNGFDTEMVGMEDTDLLFRLCFNTEFCFVNLPLVDLNCTSLSVKERLTWLLTERGDRMYRCNAYMFRKWLQLLEHRDDKKLYQKILDSQKGLYYDWLVIKLKQFRWSDSIPLVKQITHMGDGWWTICAVLFARAMRRIFRKKRSTISSLSAS